MEISNEPASGMLTADAAKKICDFYGLPSPSIRGECWVTVRNIGDSFPFRENRNSKGEILLNLWLVVEILRMHPDFFGQA